MKQKLGRIASRFASFQIEDVKDLLNVSLRETRRAFRDARKACKADPQTLKEFGIRAIML